MAKHTFNFSIPDDDHEAIKILNEWKAEFGDRGVSRQIRLAMRFYRADQKKGTKIDAFMGKNGRLDIMPPIWDEWNRDDLVKQDVEDLLKLRRQIDRNLGLLNRHINTIVRMR